MKLSIFEIIPLFAAEFSIKFTINKHPYKKNIQKINENIGNNILA